MGVLLERIAAAEHRFLWVEDTEYAALLLAGGASPWFDAAAYVAWRRTAQGLFKSDVIALSVGPMFAAWVDADPALRAAMGAKRRVNFPLKTLLAAQTLRRQAGEMLAGLRSTAAQLPLAMVCPSPRAWLQDAYRFAFGESAPEVGEDEVDTATLHCADFLREFGSSGIDSVLLEESPSSEPAAAEELAWYRSVLNVGAHYRWDTGLRMAGDRYAGTDVPGFDYCIAARPLRAPCTGIAIAEDFWSGAAPCDLVADFHFVRIPPGTAPETVLDRLAQLRAS
jgi:hypothetical protein